MGGGGAGRPVGAINMFGRAVGLTRDHSDMVNRLNALHERFIPSPDGNSQDPSPADYAFLLGVAMTLRETIAREIECVAVGGPRGDVMDASETADAIHAAILAALGEEP